MKGRGGEEKVDRKRMEMGGRRDISGGEGESEGWKWSGVETLLIWVSAR